MTTQSHVLFPIDDFLTHNREENSAVAQVWESSVLENLAKGEHPRVKSFLLQDFENKELSFSHLLVWRVWIWVQKAVHRDVLVVIKFAECCVPFAAVKLGKDSLHVCRFQSVECRVRNLADFVSLDKESYELTFGVYKDSFHFCCERLFASE